MQQQKYCPSTKPVSMSGKNLYTLSCEFQEGTTVRITWKYSYGLDKRMKRLYLSFRLFQRT